MPVSIAFAAAPLKIQPVVTTQAMTGAAQQQRAAAPASACTIPPEVFNVLNENLLKNRNFRLGTNYRVNAGGGIYQLSILKGYGEGEAKAYTYVQADANTCNAMVDGTVAVSLSVSNAEDAKKLILLPSMPNDLGDCHIPREVLEKVSTTYQSRAAGTMMPSETTYYYLGKFGPLKAMFTIEKEITGPMKFRRDSRDRCLIDDNGKLGGRVHYEAYLCSIPQGIQDQVKSIIQNRRYTAEIEQVIETYGWEKGRPTKDSNAYAMIVKNEVPAGTPVYFNQTAKVEGACKIYNGSDVIGHIFPVFYDRIVE